MKFTAAAEDARGRVARGHTGPLDIDYDGQEGHSLPCAFCESGALACSCWCARGGSPAFLPAQKWHGDQADHSGHRWHGPATAEKVHGRGQNAEFFGAGGKGSFRLLTTSIPPQSPVAWSNLITGMNPGGHGILISFIVTQDTTALFFGFARGTAEARHSSGQLGDPHRRRHRRAASPGQGLWETLDDYGVPNTIFACPRIFLRQIPRVHPVGMGTPDLRGSYGTFSYYTDDPMTAAGVVEGGQIIPVQVENSQVKAKLIGPDNTFRKGSPPTLEPFTVSIDPLEAVAKFSVQGQKFVLREGEWSDWIHIQFQLIPFIGNVKGICRFYLKQAHPRFELYVSPINIDPADPALPLSTPKSYSRELSEERVVDVEVSREIQRLCRRVCWTTRNIWSRRRPFWRNIARFSTPSFPSFTGLFFFYFSSLDLNSHMLWRLIDSQHPEYDASLAAEYGSALPEFYQQIDQVLGEVLQRMDDQTTVLVLSDHGFAPYNRSFNLNTWLLNHGYITLKTEPHPDQSQAFANVDWSRTRAYGLGLNGMYLNLRGREREGIVEPGARRKRAQRNQRQAARRA